MPDSILYNDQLGPIAASNLQVTPTGGTTTNLGSVLNGGTIAQSIPAGSTIGAGTTLLGSYLESVTNAITASTTQTLAGAVALTAANNVISTVATAGNAVKLPLAGVANIGQVILVMNNGASACAVFPGETSTAIDSGSTAASVTLTNGHSANFVQNTASTWVSQGSVGHAS
jgi:hypothetical protein